MHLPSFTIGFPHLNAQTQASKRCKELEFHDELHLLYWQIWSGAGLLHMLLLADEVTQMIWNGISLSRPSHYPQNMTTSSSCDSLCLEYAHSMSSFSRTALLDFSISLISGEPNMRSDFGTYIEQSYEVGHSTPNRHCGHHHDRSMLFESLDPTYTCELEHNSYLIHEGHGRPRQ